MALEHKIENSGRFDHFELILNSKVCKKKKIHSIFQFKYPFKPQNFNRFTSKLTELWPIRV
jgi:hypothetical protein